MYFFMFTDNGKRRGKTKLLDNGTELFFVIESITDRSFSDMPYHFEITSGKITGRISGGFIQYIVPTTNRFGRGSNLEYPRTSIVGKSVFLTYKEAAEYADRRSDRYEATWGYALKEPLLRPWREEKQGEGKAE